MKDTILKRQQGNLLIHVYTMPDESPDLSYLEQDYKEENATDRATYKAQDKQRLDDYHKGNWYMLGVCCDISIITATNWAVPTIIGRSSVWGVESDSGDYLKELAEEQIVEAMHDIENVKAALCGN